MIGKDGSVIRFTDIELLPSDCPSCADEKLTRMFCAECRGVAGLPCNWCADTGYRTKDGRFVRCEDEWHKEKA